jgi:hypothetical protein
MSIDQTNEPTTPTPTNQIRDTRLFHRFGSGEIGRETSRQEFSFAQLREKGLPTEPSEYRDPNVTASRLGACGGLGPGMG